MTTLYSYSVEIRSAGGNIISAQSEGEFFCFHVIKDGKRICVLRPFPGKKVSVDGEKKIQALSESGILCYQASSLEGLKKWLQDPNALAPNRLERKEVYHG